MALKVKPRLCQMDTSRPFAVASRDLIIRHVSFKRYT